MSETLFIVGEVVLYQNGEKFELGIVKSICERKPNDWEQSYFVLYHTGDTAARTGESHLHKIVNRYAFHIVRLDPDDNERKGL